MERLPHRLFVLGAALLLAFCLLPSRGAKADDGLRIGSFRWGGELAPGGRVEVRNPLGDVRVRSTGEAQIGVSAIIQNLRGGQANPEITVQPTESGYSVAVGATGESFKGRVDLTLLLPDPTELNVVTTFGNLDARFQGDLRARTVSGALRVDTPGHVDLETRTGSIALWLGNRDWEHPMRVRSERGHIAARVPAGANLVVRVETAGEVETRPTPETAPRIDHDAGGATWAFREGGTLLEVLSKTGNVSVQAQPGIYPKTATPTVTETPVEALPRTIPWQPGDPIKETPRN